MPARPVSFRRSAGFAVAAALGAVAAIAFTPRDAVSAAGAAGAVKTHFGAAAGDLVTLQLDGPANDRKFSRVLPNGTTETDWRVPSGSALFATDVEWASGWADEQKGYDDRVLRLRIRNDATPAQAATVMFPAFQGSHFPIDAQHVYEGGAMRATVGFLLGTGAHLVADAPSSLDANGDADPGPFLGEVVVRGYLVRAK